MTKPINPLTPPCFATGSMDDGTPAIFRLTKKCGDMGFYGYSVSGGANVVCKAGYIPFADLTGFYLSHADAMLAERERNQ